MVKTIEQKEKIVIKFAGDSGDGMQLTGAQFTESTAFAGSDLATFPDYPAEIRAPQGTVAGVSGFQIHFGSLEIYTPGDTYDVLVAMNAAALKTNLANLKKEGILIANISGFDAKNLRLSGYENNPLEDGTIDGYQVIKIDVTKMTRDALSDIEMGIKEKDRSKNMFVLGFLYWMYDRSLDSTINFLKSKFGKKPAVLDANIRALKSGYNFGNTTETFTTRYHVGAARLKPGTYRGIMGNQATALGLIAAARNSNLPLFLGSYPITPASDILHELSKHKEFGVKTFQAEDEIAGICSAIGAAFGGSLAVTTTSGPGVALKTEAIGLAIMLELPLVIVNVQRAGPSTGMPTKTEQADLLQALYGRNGEAPMPVLAASTPSDCFNVVYEACRIAVQHMVPVILLTDGYIANGAEPWRFPQSDDLQPIEGDFAKPAEGDEIYKPYTRDENLVRPWAIPGTKGLEHRVGGLEKEDITGYVSYNPENHEKMVKIRAEKVDRIADHIPLQEIEKGPQSGKLLVMGWGSTYGAIKSAVNELVKNGNNDVAMTHLSYLNPLPRNLGEILSNFDHVLIPEMNNGQLVKVIRDQYLIPAISYTKIKGIPFTSNEIIQKINEIIG